MEHSSQKQPLSGDINRSGWLTAAASPAGKARGKINLYLSMVLWNKQFETGSSQLDLQHRTLINNINHLEGMLMTTNPTREECEFVIHLVEFLEDYADAHFNLEEECMERYRCPAHKKNKEAHEQFRAFFKHFKERYNAEGFRREILLSLHKAVDLWIEQHILRVDTQLRPCIKD